jgi:hypothetical protein
MWWARYVALLQEIVIVYSVLMRKYDAESYLEGIGLHGKIILTRSLKK